MPDWDYGGAYLRHPCGEGTVVFSSGSIVKAHDIFNPLPGFMLQADVIFTDSPWNTGNLRSFYTKANLQTAFDFTAFSDRLFSCIGEIAPKVCYLEIGKENLADFIIRMQALYPHVTFYNSTYYRKRSNKCYIVRGSASRDKPKLDDMDEEDIIAWKNAHELTFIQCACRFTENCTMCDNGGGGSKRQEVKQLLKRLNRDGGKVEKNVFNAIHTLQFDTFPGWKSKGEEHSFLEWYDEG